ncbi:MAG: hypothetical protein ACI4IJ_08205 [Acutalibacteraceae bacterium]
MDKIKNDVFFVCTIIEYLGRYTFNHRGDIVRMLGIERIKHQLDYADVNHCLDMEQVAVELIEDAGITNGSFDSVGQCIYKVPSVTAIGKLYQRLIFDVMDGSEPLEQMIYNVFTSFISDAISDFNTSVYYSSPDYLRCSYLEGELLDD